MAHVGVLARPVPFLVEPCARAWASSFHKGTSQKLYMNCTNVQELLENHQLVCRPLIIR